MKMIILTFRKDVPQKKKKVKEFLRQQIGEKKEEIVFIGKNKNVYEILLTENIKPLSQWKFGRMKVLSIEKKGLTDLIRFFSSCNECAICFIGN